MTPRLAVALRAATALLLLAALPARAAPAKGRSHPEVAGEQDCADCHRTGTPEVFSSWEGSAHGIALVKCVVCHGSTGKDFRARPDAGGCRGCHEAQIQSHGQGAARNCFSCHRPHSLAANQHCPPGTP